MSILHPQIVSGEASARPDRHAQRADIDLDQASSHSRLDAAGRLIELLVAAGQEKSDATSLVLSDPQAACRPT
jgi:hypothetical protein